MTLFYPPDMTVTVPLLTDPENSYDTLLLILTMTMTLFNNLIMTMPLFTGPNNDYDTFN